MVPHTTVQLARLYEVFKLALRSALTPLELQSRFGDKALKFQVICPQLSPKRDWSSKRVNARLQRVGCVASLNGVDRVQKWRH